jgi:hypothetical protein
LTSASTPTLDSQSAQATPDEATIAREPGTDTGTSGASVPLTSASTPTLDSQSAQAASEPNKSVEELSQVNREISKKAEAIVRFESRAKLYRTEFSNIIEKQKNVALASDFFGTLLQVAPSIEREMDEFIEKVKLFIGEIIDKCLVAVISRKNNEGFSRDQDALDKLLRQAILDDENSLLKKLTATLDKKVSEYGIMKRTTINALFNKEAREEFLRAFLDGACTQILNQPSPRPRSDEEVSARNSRLKELRNELLSTQTAS